MSNFLYVHFFEVMRPNWVTSQPLSTLLYRNVSFTNCITLMIGRTYQNWAGVWKTVGRLGKCQQCALWGMKKLYPQNVLLLFLQFLITNQIQNIESAKVRNYLDPRNTNNKHMVKKFFFQTNTECILLLLKKCSYVYIQWFFTVFKDLRKSFQN